MQKIFAMALAMVLAGALGAYAETPAAPPAGGPGHPQIEAPGGGPGGGPHMGEMEEGMGFGPWIMKDLSLTDDQVKKLKEDRATRGKATNLLKAEMKNLHIDLFAEVGKDQPDMSKVDKLAQQIGGVHAKLVSDRVKGAIYLRSLLTPEQRKKLDAGMMAGPGCGPMKGGNKDGKMHGPEGHEGHGM